MTTTNYIWDEQNYLAEADGTNAINVVYTNEPQKYGNLVSSRIAGTTSYHAFDALGSTRQLTNQSGTTTDTMIYDAWGNVTSRTGTTGFHLLWVGTVGYYFDSETGIYSIRHRSYSATTNRWAARDQFRFLWTVRLPYVYAGNSPLRFIDPSGDDFIAVADRAVRGTLGIFYHYSLEQWTCRCSMAPFLLEPAGRTPDVFMRICPNGTKDEAVELLARTGWSVWGRRIPTALDPDPRSEVTTVWISDIQYDDSGTRVMPIFDASAAQVASKWATLIAFAKLYPWAEQRLEVEGTPRHRPRQWLKSMYKSFQTNSNTFIREMVRQAGLNMVEMTGLHPGNDVASQNNEDGWTFTSDSVPWKTPLPASPRPYP